MCRWQFERGRTREFGNLFDLAKEFCEQSSDDDALSILGDIHFCLGAIASETNSHTASREHKEKALNLQQQLCRKFDMIDPRLARCHSELGIARIQDGDYKAAIETLERSITIDKQLGQYPYNWVAEVNLGFAYMLDGNLAAADEVLSGTQQRREETFGINDTESYRSAEWIHQPLQNADMC